MAKETSSHPELSGIAWLEQVCRSKFVGEESTTESIPLVRETDLVGETDSEETIYLHKIPFQAQAYNIGEVAEHEKAEAFRIEFWTNDRFNLSAIEGAVPIWDGLRSNEIGPVAYGKKENIVVLYTNGKGRVVEYVPNLRQERNGEATLQTKRRISILRDPLAESLASELDQRVPNRGFRDNH